ncbi:MAG: Mg2+ and Co2+ transporter CorB [Ruminiclostridium sp.]|nr:Mg2+ and Co2+ transporter CorB [Ruminiclostridium sp.]
MDEGSKRSADDKKVKFKQNGAGSKKKNIIWILLITIISFFTSAVLSWAASDVLKVVDILTAFLVILFIVLVNIIADTIGTAVTAANETPFHAMASRKLYGAKQAIRLIRNADKVSNVCNDVIGDICGVISGVAGAYIIIRIIGEKSEITLAELVITGLIAAVTVGGKALGKIIAIGNSNYIVYKVGVVIRFLTGNTYKSKKKGLKRNYGNKK